MQQFMRKFTQLNGVTARVVLEHRLFDKQVFYCEELKTVNDNDRVGVAIQGQTIFSYKHEVKMFNVQDGRYVISDGRLTIIVEKL